MNSSSRAADKEGVRKRSTPASWLLA